MYSLQLFDDTGWFEIDSGSCVALILSAKHWLYKGNAARVVRYDNKFIYGIRG